MSNKQETENDQFSMNCKSVLLFFWLSMGLEFCAANFGEWIKLINNKTRSASEDLNKFIDQAKVGVGKHLIGNSGHPVSLQKNDDQLTLDADEYDGSGNGKAEERYLLDEKRILDEVDEGGTPGDFGFLDSEDGLFVGSENESYIEDHLRNETIFDEEEEGLKLKTSTLTIPTIIGISIGGCVCIIIIVILSILAILRKKKDENVSNTEPNQYDRGYGEEVGSGNRGSDQYDGGYYQGGRSDYYPVI